MMSFKVNSAWISKEALLRASWAAAFIMPSMYLLAQGQFRVLVTITVLVTLLLLWMTDRSLAICCTFAFLLLLGDLRRLVSVVFGPATLDPILLTGAMFTVYLALPLLLNVRVHDRISKSVLCLTLIMLLEIVNPRQGPVLVGISGALFYLIPLLWFWIGRRYGTSKLFEQLIYRVFIPLGVLAAILGLYQNFVGFLPWESAWIKQAVANGLTALYLSKGVIRAFGFSASGIEYITLLLLTSVFLFAAVLAGKRAYGLLLLIVLPAQVLASSRTAIIKLLFAVAMMWALKGNERAARFWVVRLCCALAVGVGVLGYSVSQVGGAPSEGGSAAQIATRHVTEGLSHPLDQRTSTAGLHGQMFLGGIETGFRYPLGAGLGAVTLGAGKFGGDNGVSGSSEVDISDAFISMGVIGGLLFLLTIVFTLTTTFSYLRTAPLSLGLPLLGMLTALLGGWIGLGQYALAPFTWFCIGHLVHVQQATSSLKTQRQLRSPTSVLDGKHEPRPRVFS